jgi:cytochrome c556
MRLVCLLAAAVAITLGSFMAVWAHVDVEELPAGPIRDRHVLMEQVGKNAKIIGEAMKAAEVENIAAPAAEIEKAAQKLPDLFPEGSEHPKSRAKPEIWTDPSGFTFAIKRLETTAAALAAAAQKGANVPQAANELFAACKACHDNFRIPEE